MDVVSREGRGVGIELANPCRDHSKLVARSSLLAERNLAHKDIWPEFLRLSTPVLRKQGAKIWFLVHDVSRLKQPDLAAFIEIVALSECLLQLAHLIGKRGGAKDPQRWKQGE